MTAPSKKAFPLRLDPALYAAIERTAASDLRSVNAQVECLLREALAKRGLNWRRRSLRVVAGRRNQPKENDMLGLFTSKARRPWPLAVSLIVLGLGLLIQLAWRK